MNIRKLNSDIGDNVKTIFEQAGEGNFVSSFNFIYRGSQFLTPQEFTSASILKNLEKVFKNPQDFFPNKELPKVSVAYVPATDDLLHNKGFDHPDYAQEIINCDKYIGSLINTLKDLGLYDDTAIGIISDHGNYKVDKVYDLEPFFNQIGLKQYQPKKCIGDFDATMGSVGFFNFPGDNWHLHPTIKELNGINPSGVGKQNINIFKMLWKIPGVKFMYYRDDDNTPDKGIIHIESRKTNSSEILKGQIEYEGHGKNQKTRYIFNEREFYGYEKSELSANLLDNKSHTIEEWLKGTNQMDFPMIIDQIPRYFKNPRSCDILISTLGDYGFNYEHGKTVNDHVYSHDVALKKSMTVPLIIGGSPKIPSYEIKYCKTTDLVPTLLDLLGNKPHWTVVGRSIIN